MKLVLFILLFPIAIFSQTDWEKTDPQAFLELIREYEKTISEKESYSLETSYRIYNNYSDPQPVQSFEGRLACKAGKELNVFQMGHILIQDGTLNLTIDTVSKQILVQKPDPAFFYRKTIQDYSGFLEITETVSKKTVNGKVHYLLQLKKGNPYQAMEFAFSDKNFISQVVIYSNQPYYTESDYTPGRAKIVLDFKNFKKGRFAELSRFLTVKDFVEIKDKQLTAIGTYAGFEVVDLRTQTTKL
jgi:hypothetical protein